MFRILNTITTLFLFLLSFTPVHASGIHWNIDSVQRTLNVSSHSFVILKESDCRCVSIFHFFVCDLIIVRHLYTTLHHPPTPPTTTTLVWQEKDSVHSINLVIIISSLIDSSHTQHSCWIRSRFFPAWPARCVPMCWNPHWSTNHYSSSLPLTHSLFGHHFCFFTFVLRSTIFFSSGDDHPFSFCSSFVTLLLSCLPSFPVITQTFFPLLYGQTLLASSFIDLFLHSWPWLWLIHFRYRNAPYRQFGTLFVWSGPSWLGTGQTAALGFATMAPMTASVRPFALFALFQTFFFRCCWCVCSWPKRAWLSINFGPTILGPNFKKVFEIDWNRFW